MINCSCFKPPCIRERIDSITIQRYCTPSSRLCPRAEFMCVRIYKCVCVYPYVYKCTLTVNNLTRWQFIGRCAGEGERMTQKTSVSKIATVFIGSRTSPSFSIFLYSSGLKTQRPRGRFVVTNPKGHIYIYIIQTLCRGYTLYIYT